MPDSKKKQLNSSAKAFVPQSQLKASAAAWVPSPSDNASNNKSPSSDSNNAPPVTNTKQTTTTVENITTTTTTTASTATSTEASASTTNNNNNIPSVAPTAGAWGKRPSEAIRTAPTQPPITNIPTNTTNKEKDSSSKHHHNHGKKGGGGGGGGDGKDNHHHHHHHHHNHGQQHAGHNNRRGTRGGRSKGGDSQNDASDENWSRGASLPVDLYQPGDEGGEGKIMRITADALLALRLLCLDPPSSWNSSSTTTTKEEGAEEDANNNNFAEHWKWTTDTRVQDIEAIVNNTGGGNGTSGDGGVNNTPPSPGGSGGRRKGGGNSKGKQDGNNDTAPSLDDCKPLEVNEETRWKAKVFSNTNASNTTEDESSTTNEDSDDIVLKKSLLILNKLSLTKFDKLSDSFIESGIGRNEKCLTGAIELIVNKAQDEPHFSAMYAALCLKLSRTPMEFERESMNEGSGSSSSSSKGGKKFKKMLLAQCQKEFEQDTETKIANAIQNVEDEDEKQYIADVFKKHYLGHMRFIGELYKSDLINIKIMQFVLANLLDIDDDDEDETQVEEGGASGKNKAVDEEKVECFAKLMSTIGFSLEQQSNSMKSVGKTDAFKKLQDCWEMVNTLINSNKDSGRNVSNRIKFMLQDLIEMRDNGWVKRRKEETAKTIAQIHKEAAKEAKRSSSSSNLVGMRRQSSSGDMRKIKEKPVVDADGFVQVSSSSGISKSLSMGNISRSSSSEMRSNAPPKKDGSMKRVSSGGAFAAFNESSSSSRRASTGSYRKEKSDSKLPNVEEQKEANVNRIEYKSPEECGTKIKTILKEFFVSGDIDDATLSVHELIGAGAEGSIDRGMKVLESGIMLVLEMKQEEVDKFNKLVLRCLNEKKIEKDAIVSGLNYPLELLSDISIDAPLASSHLTSIITELIKSGAVSFDFFLNSPEYFRTDCGAAQFSCKVLKKLGGEAMQDATNLEVVDKLMTDFDKGTFATAKDLLDA